MSESTTERTSSPESEGGRHGGTYRLLFVCTGNTCRSPMAEAIARALAQARGQETLEVRSAGVGAFPGAPPSGGAVRAAARRGIELEEHRATLLTRREVEWADLILTMSPSHLMRVSELGGGSHATLLTAYAGGEDRGRSGGSVPDPIGGTDEEYERTYQRLEELVEKVLERLGEEEGT